MAVKIGIANRKGGIGKSTTALALAAGLQLKGYKVLMIDTDPQCSTSHVYDAKFKDTATLYDLIFSKLSGKECIQHTEYGNIIACDENLMDAETKVNSGPNIYKFLKKGLKEIENDYDFIICDTPPHSILLLGNVLMYCEHIIVPVTCDGFGIQGLIGLNEMIKEYQEENESLSVLGILGIRYKAKQNLTKDIEESFLTDYARQMNTQIFDTKIRESVKCQEAQTMKKSIFEYAPQCTTSIDYMQLTEEILEKIKETK